MTWSSVPLGEVVELNYGKPLPDSGRSENGPVPVFGANGVKAYSERSLHQGPSVIIGRKGSAGEINRTDGPFWPLDVTYFTTHDDSKLDFDFLEYALRQMDLPSLAKGVKPGINRNEVYALPLPLPPLEEQKLIVAVLDQAFAALDRARTFVEANLADATSIYRSSLNAYVGEAIDQFGSTFLQELCKHITDGDHSPPPKAASGVPFVTISNIDKQTGELNFDRTFFVPLAYYEALQDSRKPTVGDLLYTVTGTLGVPSLVVTDRKFCFQRHVAIIKPKATTSPEWLLHVLRSQFVFKQANDGSTGAAQKTVSLKALRGLQVPKIDAAAQEAAAAKLAALWQAAEPLRRCYETQLKELGQLRQALLQQAFAGELT